MHKSLHSVIISLISSIAIIVLVLGILVLIYSDSPPPIENSKLAISKETGSDLSSDDSILFEITVGESVSEVGLRLEKLHIIKSMLLWRLLGKIDHEPIKAGYYTIKLPVRMTTLRELLVSGRQQLFRITIPEGFTLKKVASTLEQEGICSSVSLITASKSKALLDKFGIGGTTTEGYLYPDTYFFPKEYPAEKIVETMITTFFKRLNESGIEYKGLEKSDFSKLVILASIVEREYRIPSEAPIIAGVFQNRLQQGMPLQSCATVEYIITEILDRPHPERLFHTDIDIKNPYNSYLYSGLPPGPICSPGLVALEAAFHPQQTNYLYFRIASEDGRHVFSKTFDQHINAGIIYTKTLKTGL